MATAKKKHEHGTGSVYFRSSDQRWVGRLKIGQKPNGKPDYKVVYCKSEPEAHKRLKEIYLESVKTEYVYVNKESFAAYLDLWMTTVKILELKPKSYDRLEQTINLYVKPSLGEIQLSTVTSDDIQQMLAKLKDEGKSYSTIKKAYDAVNGAFKWGLRCEPPKVKKNPAANVIVPSRKLFAQKQIPFYTKDEATALITQAYSKCGNGKRRYPLGAFVPLLINTGLRMGELLALKWGTDIDFENRTLKVHNNIVFVRDRDKDKGYKLLEQETVKSDAGQDRTIPLNDNAYAALLDIYQVTGNETYVMTTSEHTHVKPRQLDQMFRRIAVATGLPEDKIYGVHALRHTFATLLLSNGIDIKTVSSLLGHADVSITYNTYIHVMREQKAKALDTIPDILA